MKQYKVLCDFYDSQDEDRVYRKGDLYPHEDKETDENRIKELGSENNSTGIKLIDLPIELESDAEIKAEQAEKKKQQEADKKAAAEAKKAEGKKD
ncbi:hypothetical protein [Enterococcus caccae]|uniref:Uncharacterized protein n=1 Tax=Enterococcus caccae ATCC BAA-1240 TaxID=1158612 RepID=R3WVI8_9ENTE|nr:hypothetical protein [Enterococcus caccae]EOL45815.1 hypothetical protein UC7_01612 [Enterococcus caccae ATCC BAA-1240]EOT61011.1 hypothetical protein I580_01913 [Enterococcus caccae ATCC BAA-1240]OJG27958.1 hypothetical protein RU98_GL002167 [Enterococcus caccae]